MTQSAIPLHLAVEGDVDEVVLKKIIDYCGRSFFVRTIPAGGYTAIKSRMNEYNRAAQKVSFLVLTDLDRDECAPAKIRSWLSSPAQKNMLFRIAVRSIEAWLMADREGLAKYLKVAERHIPEEVESIDGPKQFLIGLARKSKSRAIREDMVPPARSTSKQGPGYNLSMIAFVVRDWNIDRARRRSDSLNRAIKAIERFRPE